MDELIGRLAANAGVETAVAEKAVGIVLSFLRSEGPSKPVEMLIGSRLIGLGSGMTDIQNVARELFRFGRDEIGAERTGAMIAGTPGLSQFA